MSGAQNRCPIQGCGHALSMHNKDGRCRSWTTPDKVGSCRCDGTEESARVVGDPGPSITERLLVLSVRRGNCLLWMGHCNHAGYGVFKVDNRSRGAHRVAYEEWVGHIPQGLEIDHLCGVRNCIAPAHLEAVTHRENLRRARARAKRAAA